MKFFCHVCRGLLPLDEMNLDAGGYRVCRKCYLENPPAVDVEGVFAEVVARFRREMADERRRVD